MVRAWSASGSDHVITYDYYGYHSNGYYFSLFSSFEEKYNYPVYTIAYGLSGFDIDCNGMMVNSLFTWSQKIFLLSNKAILREIKFNEDKIHEPYCIFVE